MTNLNGIVPMRLNASSINVVGWFVRLEWGLSLWRAGCADARIPIIGNEHASIQ
jgi:hypothetical protein